MTTKQLKHQRSDFKPGRHGVAFKNGKFYSFDKKSVLVMSAWPDPRAWLRRKSHNWRATRKHADRAFIPMLYQYLYSIEPSAEPPPLEFERILPSGQCLMPEVWEDDETKYWKGVEQKATHIYRQYYETFPVEVRKELIRYSDRLWHICSLFARCPGALDLSRSNPAILYALASNWVFHKPAVTRPVRAARSLVYRKQKDILTWLGFPGTETARRITMKIAPRSLSACHLLYLRAAFKDPFVVSVLSHTERINAGALRLATNRKFRDVVTPRLIAEVGQDRAQDSGYMSVVSILEDTMTMARRANRARCPRKFGSLARLMEVHDELAARICRDDQTSRTLPARFADPPFAGTRNIRPIMTPDDLRVEGMEMDHCVGAYSGLVADGSVFVYKVLEPLRATLSIRLTSDGWTVGELFTAGNGRVSKEVRHEVFRDLFRSGAYSADRPVFRHRDPLSLAESGQYPLFLVEEEEKQMPLLPPVEFTLYKRCLKGWAFEESDTSDSICPRSLGRVAAC